jgi:hypothetical protein
MSFIDSSYGDIGYEGSGFPRAGSADANSLSGGSSPLSISPLQAGALGLGVAGAGYMLSQGEQKLPAQYGQLTASVPRLQAEAGLLQGQGQALVGQGSALTGQGTEALRKAAAGELTDPQKAQLGQFETGLTNQTRQQFYNMGRNPDQDTGFIGQTAANDAQVNVMAQQQIQSTIALGLGELTSGSSFAGTGLSFESAGLGYEGAANSALVQAGQAQLAQDKAYSDSLTSVFGTIGKLFGTVAGAAVGGPAGAMVGGTLGGAAGSAIG